MITETRLVKSGQTFFGGPATAFALPSEKFTKINASRCKWAVLKPQSSYSVNKHGGKFGQLS
ncbi:hypothetical protein [Paraglaciecola marina]|uniref:hypothetical protein n=1 Tax=Paraglaciecola marina TaxID=2500157 RepID=UPI00105FDC93|nr:hypothetical protein [Paraglaciecola marina]